MPGLIAAKLWRLVTPIKDTDNRLVQIAFAAGWLVVAPLLLIGLALSLKRSPATACLLLLPILATLASTVVFYGSDRFRNAVAPVLLVFAAVGLLQLLRVVSRQRATTPIASVDIQHEETRAA